MQPELRTLERALLALRDVGPLASRIDAAGRIEFASLALEEIAAMLADEVASLVLFAAADLNRTALRAGMEEPDAQIVPRPLRRAFVVQSKLPQAADFSTVVELAMQRRAGTLGRNANAAIESLFRDRLEFEGLPIRMRGAFTSGILIDRRKPDGVFPDPASGRAPELYLEIKKVNRVRDDIQKRLYEIAEVSLEVKFLYGALQLTGLNLSTLLHDDDREAARAGLRGQIIAAQPAVVALLICRAEELELARRYRPRAEAFIDRLFFADEIEECLAFLAEIASPGASPA
jgi:hypothetical protein